MQITARQLVLQHAHVLQCELFPQLQEALGPLSPDLQLLVSVSALAPPHKLAGLKRHQTGRPAKDRTALACAFLAKAILNLPATRDLISRLRVHEALRRLCGWRRADAVPHESKFSRAFAESAATELPQQLHAMIVAQTQSSRLVGHIARDSTAIPAREHFPLTASQARKRQQADSATERKKHPKGSFQKAKASQSVARSFTGRGAKS